VFGVGLPELAVIMLVAVLVFGPDRLPDLARQAGRMVRQVRRMANAARDELREELGPDYADLELRDLDPREIVRRHIAEALEDEDDDEPRARSRRGQRPLGDGEAPPYDVDAT
jgi:sec-independent protein translocase protein TatB